MDAWIVWLIAAAVLGIGEMHTGGLYLLPFALGAAIAALLSAVGVGFAASLIAFAAVSVVVVAGLRPIARRHRRLPPPIRTGAAALVGHRAMVIERIANEEGVGCVKIDGGEVWTARSLDDDEVIEAGERVEVVDIKGATALVMR
ncbi:MAG TPA: NfeD family protein [Solirubrobacteraceae bacterium]|nr:NfeD family protein [Solirubrobacteraceae bacterium]